MHTAASDKAPHTQNTTFCGRLGTHRRTRAKIVQGVLARLSVDRWEVGNQQVLDSGSEASHRSFAANHLGCRFSHFADSGNGEVRRVSHALVARRAAEPQPLPERL